MKQGIRAAVLGLALATALPHLALAGPPPEPQPAPSAPHRAPGWSYQLRLQRVWNHSRSGVETVAQSGRDGQGAGAPQVPAATGGPTIVASLPNGAVGGVAFKSPVSVGNATSASLSKVPAAAIRGETPAGDDVLNLLLLGTDRRPDDGSWRTDTIVLVSIDKTARRAGMVSIPRDLWVDIPGYGAGRINTADYLGARGGGEDGALIKDTVARNLGVPVQHFIRVNFQAFVTVVDALGGVDVVVDCPLEDYFLDDGVAGPGPVSVQPGVQHLDGTTALRYARSRHSTSDFDRSRRQQRVLRAMVARAREQGLLRSAPRILAAVREHVQTDLGLPELLALAALAARFDDLAVRSTQLDSRQLVDWTTPQGAMVLVMDPAAVQSTMASVLAAETADDRERAVAPGAVALVNHTGRDTWDQIAVASLVEQGVSVSQTRVGAPEAGSAVYYAPGSKTLAGQVAAALDLDDEDLRPLAALPVALQLGADVQVTLGADWSLACR